MKRYFVAALVAAAAVAAIAGRTVAQGSEPNENATAQLLSELIPVDTDNPPGHEGLIDELLAAKLKPLGFEIEIVPTPTELVYRTLVAVAARAK